MKTFPCAFCKRLQQFATTWLWKDFCVKIVFDSTIVMQNKVLETNTFSRLFETLEKKEKEWIKKVIRQLKENSDVGKPLKFDWFREKKLGGKRLHYLVYGKSNTVLLVAFGGKKDQKKIISQVLQNRGRYKRIIEEN